MTWPPTLEQVKADLKREEVDTRDDVAIKLRLDAAVHFVQTIRDGEFNFAGDELVDLPEPGGDLVLGTIMLTSRWYSRRRSPDLLIQAADMGTARIPSFDPDIERLLGIGRFRGPVIA